MSDTNQGSLHDRLNTTKEKISVNLECMNDRETNVEEKEQLLKSVMDEIGTMEMQLDRTKGEHDTKQSNLEREKELFFVQHKQKLESIESEYEKLQKKWAELDDALNAILKNKDVVVRECEALKKQERETLVIEKELENQRLQLSQVIHANEPESEMDGVSDEIEEMNGTCANVQRMIDSGNATIKGLSEVLREKRQQIQQAAGKADELRQEISRKGREKVSDVKQLEINLKKAKAPSKVPELTAAVKVEEKKVKGMRRNNGELKKEKANVAERILELENVTKSRRQEIEDVKQQADDVREKGYALTLTGQKVKDSFKKLQHARRKKEGTMEQLKELSAKLKESYNVEAQQNKVLPSLLRSIQEAEEEGEKLEGQWIELNQDQDVEESQEQTLVLSRVWQDLHLKLQLAKMESERIEKSLSQDIEDVRLRVASEMKETKREIRAKTKLTRIRSEIYTIQQAIVKEKERQQRRRNQKAALENQTRRKKEELANLQQMNGRKRQPPVRQRRIATEEIRLATRKAIAEERRVMFNKKSSELFDKTQVMNVRAMVDTHAMKCDPAARTMLLRRAAMRA